MVTRVVRLGWGGEGTSELEKMATVSLLGLEKMTIIGGLVRAGEDGNGLSSLVVHLYIIYKHF